MKANHLLGTLLTGALLSLAQTAMAQGEHKILVQANKPGATVQPTMYGIFFEDINFGADGGLYADLVENRSFEFPQHLMGWESFGSVEVMDEKPAYDRNPHYVALTDDGHLHKQTGIENRGHFGMGITSPSPHAATTPIRPMLASAWSW